MSDSLKAAWPTGRRDPALRAGARGRPAGPTGAARAHQDISFFFQAEDGIRALTVTGVQTCALPISTRGGMGREDHDFGKIAIQMFAARHTPAALDRLPCPGS